MRDRHLNGGRLAEQRQRTKRGFRSCETSKKAYFVAAAESESSGRDFVSFVPLCQ